jgi:hypothetical protein
VNRPIVSWEPFAPVAEFERQVAALTEDNTSLCSLVEAQSLMLADKCRQIALLEQEVARLKSPGRYSATRRQTVRYIGQVK